MISASAAIKYIGDNIDALITEKKLNGRLRKSKSSISIYLTVKGSSSPSKLVRSSNHHPSFKNLCHNKPKPWKTTNISIEFYEPKYDKNGKVIKNRWNTTVIQNSKNSIKPFSITIYEYKAELLDPDDIPKIYNEILQFANTGVFNDPFEGTDKAATIYNKTSNIKPAKTTKSTETTTATSADTTASIVSESNRQRKKTIIITEQQYNELFKIPFKALLTEDQTASSIRDARNLLMKTYGWDKERADKFIRIDLRNDLPQLRSKQGGKFILGVTRMFVNNELRDASTINGLNSTLKYVASEAHINEYDRNLNGMSAADLIQRFATARTNDLESEKAKISNKQYAQNTDYTIIPINSFEEAEGYGKYTSWCVTHYEHMFDNYTSNGIGQFYFCLKTGFETIKPVQGEGCPLDEYGLSMIAVSVDENGALSTCTCRWNHDNGGNDNIMTTEQISDLIGQNFYNVFKPNNKWNNILDNALQRLKNGEHPIVVFDNCSSFSNGYAIVELMGKQNFIDIKGNLLSPNQWFDECFDFKEGHACVENNLGYNFIDTKGNILSKNQWFENCFDFKEGYAAVKFNGKWNWIDGECKFLFPNHMFEECRNFNDGFAFVSIDKDEYYINKKGNLYDYGTEQPLGINVKDMKINETKTRKNIIQLTESDLRFMVNKCLREILYN